jgi:hypothetical protein
MRQVLKPSHTRFVLGPSHLHLSIVLMHQFPFVVGSCCTWHWQDLDWNQQAQGIGWREADKFWNQLELKQLFCKLQLLWSLHQYNIFLCFRTVLLLEMTLTTSGKESTSRMSSLKPHKRGRRLNF